jgi:hypothetical protein
MPLLIADVRPHLTRGLILLEPTGPPFQNAVFSTTSARKWGLTDIPMNYSPPVTTPELELVQQVVQPANLTNNNATIPCILQATEPPPQAATQLGAVTDSYCYWRR